MLYVSIINVLFVITAILCARLLPHLQQEDYQVVLSAQPYLYILAYSLKPTMILTTFARCLRLFCMIQLMMGVNLIGALLNILINHLLVYGDWLVANSGPSDRGPSDIGKRWHMSEEEKLQCISKWLCCQFGMLPTTRVILRPLPVATRKRSR